MKFLIIKVGLALTMGIGLALALWGGVSHFRTRLPVARAADHTVCLVGPSTCTYTNVQAAVDMANDGDVIKVATGVYTHLNNYVGLTQMVYISKTITIRGGYSTAFTEPPNPEANPTILDAQGQGRVLYITGHISPTIEGLRMTGGNPAGLAGTPWASDAGGGIYVISATTTLRGNQIIDNVAADGGGLFLYDSNATLVNNEVISNTADSGGGLVLYNSTELNGGEVVWDGPATVQSNSIISNTATNSGGGIFLFYSDATLTGNTVTANQAYYGGGIYVGPSLASLIGNTITNNRADSGGGGLALIFDETTLSENIVSANVAGNGGGGFDLVMSTALLNGNQIISNVALGIGGGGLFVDQSSHPTLTNNFLFDNIASGQGNGLYVRGSSPRLLHNTLARNTGGDGNGMYVAEFMGLSEIIYSQVSLTNTILVSHTVGLIVTTGNTVTLESTLWGSGVWANNIDTGGPGVIDMNNNYIGDPAFVDPDGGDYHLSSVSEAIDRGIEAGITSDIDGQLRISPPDLGADEWGGFNTIFLPLILKN